MKLFQNPNDLKHGLNHQIEYLLIIFAIIGRIEKEQGELEMNSPTSDIIVDTESNKQPKTRRVRFPSQYKESIFYLWYKHGKPPEAKLLMFITEDMDEFGRMPTISVLKLWIDEDFVPRARQLDEQVKVAMDAAMVVEKVEMLRRHAKLGVKMQDMSMKYLEENADILSSPAAVRLLVEGIRIERESRGIPYALDKMNKMTDEDLLNQVKGLLTTGMISEESNANS